MPRKSPLLATCLIVLVSSVLTAHQAAIARGRNGTLPAAVEEAVREAFPDATIKSFGREREHGALYYEVNLRNNGARLEVEVSPDGVIGEVEGEVVMADLPKDLQDRIIKATRGMKIRWIELHERRGRAERGKFVPLAKPTTRYEVKCTDGRRRRSIVIPYQRVVTLTEQAAQAIQQEFPEAKIGQTTSHIERGIEIYDVELEQGSERSHVLISPKGIIFALKNPISMDKLPPRVAKGVAPAAKDGEVTSISVVRTYAAVNARRLIKLRQPVLTYEVELDMDDMGAWFKFAADGRILGKDQWEKDDDHDDDDDNNDEDGDDHEDDDD